MTDDIARLTRERDEARDAVIDLVNATTWENGHCVIRQGPRIGSGGALDRAMEMVLKWVLEK